MSDLSAFRDHARRMSEAEHKPECAAWVGHGWRVRHVTPDPACPGCITDADRALWARLADEVDAYLSHDEEGLFTT